MQAGPSHLRSTTPTNPSASGTASFFSTATASVPRSMMSSFVRTPADQWFGKQLVGNAMRWQQQQQPLQSESRRAESLHVTPKGQACPACTPPQAASPSHQWCAGLPDPPAEPCPERHCRCEMRPRVLFSDAPPGMRQQAAAVHHAECYPELRLTRTTASRLAHLFTMSWLAGDTARMRQEGACTQAGRAAGADLKRGLACKHGRAAAKRRAACNLG